MKSKSLVWLAVMVLTSALAVAAEAATLKEKAGQYEAWFQGCNSQVYGGAANLKLQFPEPTLDRPASCEAALRNDHKLVDYSDSTLWTGTYLAAEAFRYGTALRDQDPAEMQKAQDNAKRAYRALHTHLAATGHPGLIARYVGSFESMEYDTEADAAAAEAREQACRAQDEADGDCHVIACPAGPNPAPGGSCFWLGDPSRDMYTGYFFGAALAYDLIDDPELKSLIRADLRQVINGLLEHGFKIVDIDGKKTAAGDIDLAMQLDWLLIASHVLDDQTLFQKYRRRFFWAAGPNDISSSRVWNKLSEYFALNLFHQTYFNLIRIEQDPGRKQYYQRVFKERVYRYGKNSHNPYFDYMAMGLLEAGAPDASGDAREVLIAFTGPPRTKIDYLDQPQPVWNVSKLVCAANYDLVRTRCLFKCPPGGECETRDWMKVYPVSKEARPFEGREAEDFLWQRSPYKLTDLKDKFKCSEMSLCHRRAVCSPPEPVAAEIKRRPSRNLKIYPGFDYLVAYWMGRYFGLIGPEE